MEGAPARVLVAEDSATQRAMICDLLRQEGLEVHEAPDGRVALDLARIARPDLLILDLGLPRLSGEEVLERIRRDRKIAQLPVLVLTATDREHALEASLDGGATDFVSKPVPPAELIARVRRALREKARVDDLVRRNEVLSEAARIDALTGLPNRRASAEALAEAARRALEMGRPIAVALIDIDHFKRINDTFGHHSGDQVLCAVAGRLNDSARRLDVVGRWGGEEFIAVLPDASPEQAAAAAEALRAATGARSIAIEGNQSVTVTVSVGWACSAGASPEQLLDLADVALYEAKAAGRNCVVAA